MHRTWAIIERELRRFRRSPTLIVMSLVMPVVQMVVLGYAFGGQVKHLKVGLVDQDGGVPAVRVHELSNAVAANAQTFQPLAYHDLGTAMSDLRNAHLNGVLDIPPGFSRRTLSGDDPRIAHLGVIGDAQTSSAEHGQAIVARVVEAAAIAFERLLENQRRLQR